MINLQTLQPHKVSRDLTGYITYIYGPGKIGKTTFGTQMPGALILAFQKGYNALPNIYPQDVANWMQMKIILSQLAKPTIQEKFQTIIIDTIDVAAVYCQKYVTSQAGVDALNQIPYGAGWSRVKRELEDTFRTITQLGYAVIFISHDKDKTFKRQDGTQYNQIIPTLGPSYNAIIKDMVDIYGYAHLVVKDGVPKRVLTLRSFDNSVDCGCRFKYIAPEIEFSYPALVEALNIAIDKEAENGNKEYITNEKEKKTNDTSKLDFDALMKEFNEICKSIPKDEMTNYYKPRITEIIEKCLGKGKKITNITRDQVEQLSLIVFYTKELLS